MEENTLKLLLKTIFSGIAFLYLLMAVAPNLVINFSIKLAKLQAKLIGIELEMKTSARTKIVFRVLGIVLFVVCIGLAISV